MWRPPSLRLRYTLRALLDFITLFMLWGGYHTNRSWKERAAEDILKARGASLEYATHSVEGTFGEKVAAAYSMLVETVWQDRSVSRLMLLAPLDPEVIDSICALSQLKALTTAPAPTTAEQSRQMRSGLALQPTGSMPKGALRRILSTCPVDEFNISGWALSDDDYQAIASCPSMKYLAVDGSALSEQGLAQMISKPGLVWFSFGFCDLTGSALGNTPGSPTLEKIFCCTVPPVSNELAEFVSRSPNVQDLTVGRCVASDEFVRTLGPHPSLKSLALGASAVSDNSMDDIARMPALIIVELPGTSVSPKGVVRLQQARPRLQISYH